MSRRNMLFYALLAAAMLVLLELGSAAFLHAYRALYDGRNRAVAVDDGLTDEFRVMVERSILYPTRWYSAPPLHQGRYFQTDATGFRIDPRTVGGEPDIGFFGGSTMFSVITGQNGSIPARSRIAGFQSLNFGMYGYSTTAEVMTFVEAARTYPRMRIAVFYDGVNEVARGLELVQSGGSGSALFATVGYYWDDGFQAAVANARPRHTLAYESSFLYIIDKLLAAGKVQNLSGGELDAIAVRLTDVYYANAGDIAAIARSRGVVPLFYWQPSVFTTGKILTEGEKRLAADKSLIGRLYPLVTRKVLADPRRTRIGLIDLSAGLDAVRGDIFYDWCHINRAGNTAIAAAMRPSLTQAAAGNAQSR